MIYDRVDDELKNGEKGPMKYLDNESPFPSTLVNVGLQKRSVTIKGETKAQTKARMQRERELEEDYWNDERRTGTRVLPIFHD